MDRGGTRHQFEHRRAPISMREINGLLSKAPKKDGAARHLASAPLGGLQGPSTSLGMTVELS